MNTAGGHSGRVLNMALLLLAPAVMIIVASEFIVVGLLSQVAVDLDISLSRAGGLASWWAFSAAVAGPVVTLVAGRVTPRATLISTLLLFAVGNAAVSCADDFSVMLAARVIQGAVLPAFVSVGAALVSRLAPPTERGRALARANIGFVLGVLFALPASVVLAQGADWRVPFGVLAIASVLMAVLIALLFPTVAQGTSTAVGKQVSLLGQRLFLAHLGLSVVMFAAMFAAYTYLGAWLDHAFAASAWMTAMVLFLFGAAGLVGNSIAGRLADGALLRSSAAAVLLLVVSINLAVAGRSTLMIAALPLALWSIGHTASVTLSQVRVTLVGERAPAFAMTMNISAANLGIAIGTFFGGWVIDTRGIDAIGWAPAGCAAIAIPFIVLVGRDALRAPFRQSTSNV